MKIAQKYSHLYSEEYLLVHHKKFYKKVLSVITSEEGDHEELKETLEKFLLTRRWKKSKQPGSHKKIEFKKNKIIIEIHLSEYPLSSTESFGKHLLDYSNNDIDVAIEILPTKNMQKFMSSGPPWFEKEVHNVLRHGRTNPPVPLLILGIEP